MTPGSTGLGQGCLGNGSSATGQLFSRADWQRPGLSNTSELRRHVGDNSLSTHGPSASASTRLLRWHLFVD